MLKRRAINVLKSLNDFLIIYEARNYVIFSFLLSLPLPYVQRFSSEPCSQTLSIFIFLLSEKPGSRPTQNN